MLNAAAGSHMAWRIRRLSMLTLASLIAAAAVSVSGCEPGLESRYVQIAYFDERGLLMNQSKTRLERLAGGFGQLEGPAWNPDGYLLFSDMADHVVYRWSPEDGLSSFLRQPDWSQDLPRGPNGLAFDRGGRLVLCEHGRRRLVRLEASGELTVLAERFEGRRLNSPNDLVVSSDGTIYFTDPPFGLSGGPHDSTRELPFSGVYALEGEELRLLTDNLDGPNGIGLSPDETVLYVSTSDAEFPYVWRFVASPDGGYSSGSVFFDFTDMNVGDSLDGLGIDETGNVFVSTHSAIHVLSPSGQRIASIHMPEPVHNLAFGGSNRAALFIVTQSNLYRLRPSFPGLG